ncbi:MAG: DNA polymerase III subunit delta [Rhodobiaceae bacterium]|nr:MAG: DNA polymerase III subunit delta [Rhodobiaceae bacterium]
MKLRASEIERFVVKPDPKAQVILIFGPDQGLVRERSNRLAKTVLDDLSDPFRMSDLSDGDLKSDPARLADEAAAISMMGGRRIVRVRNAGDALSKLLKSFLTDPAGDALILLEGGDLTPRSSLRKALEAAPNGAAIPCYADDARTLERVIEERLGNAGLRVEPDAFAYLASHLGSDRGVTLQELDKLILYMGIPDSADTGTRRVQLEDVSACIGDTGANRIDDIVDAAAIGDFGALDIALAKASEADTSPIAILIAVTRHVQKLHLVLGRMDTGSNRDAAIKALRPPVHFKREASMKRQCGLWDRKRLQRAMELLGDADQQCKTTGLPDRAVCAQALMRVAQGARSGGRR